MGIRRWIRCVSVGVAAALVAVAVPAAALADAGTAGLSRVTSADPDDVWVVMQNRNSYLYLAVAGSSDTNGAKVIQYDLLEQPDGHPIPDQQWLLVYLDNGYSVFRNAGTDPGKVLAVAGHSTANNAKVVQYTYQESNTDQQWLRRWITDFEFQLVNRNSGKCLAIPGGSVAAGVQAIQYTCNEGWYDQRWRLFAY